MGQRQQDLALVRRLIVVRTQHRRGVEDHRVEPLCDPLADGPLALCLGQAVRRTVRRFDQRARLVDRARVRGQIEGVDRAEMDQALDAAVQAGLDHVSRTQDVDRVQQRPLVAPDRDVPGSVVHDLRPIHRSPHGRRIPHVTLDHLHVQARQRAPVPVHQGAHRLPARQQRAHQIAPQMSCCTRHQHRHRRPPPARTALPTCTTRRWGKRSRRTAQSAMSATEEAIWVGWYG